MKRIYLSLLAMVTALGSIASTVPTGAVSGLFSVAADKQVYFSQGNLQCTNPLDATTRTWSFAEHQYDRIGTANITSYSLPSGKVRYGLASPIDLFGWSSDNATSDFGINASNLSSDYEGNFVDWGTNAITNGGNVSNLWRTLTSAEWYYLFETRTNAANLHAEGTVNGIAGTILLPDAFVLPTGSTFTPSSTNTYTTAEWTTMETAGAVFLPNTGTREGTTVEAELVDEVGVYWSATSTTTTGGLQGSALEIWGSSITYSPYPFPEGLAVRLVSDYQTYTITVETPSHGTLSANKTQAGEGETVTLTAVADADYELQGVSVLQGTTAISLVEDATQAGVYTFTMPAGAVVVKATFLRVSDYQPQPISVSPNQKVYFSQGNLQFNAVQGTHMRADGTMQQGTWRFAEYQYDVIGSNNQKISATYDGYIDLFGWGTSGYDNTANDPLAVNYQPWAFSQIRTETNTTNIWGYGPSSDQTDADLVGTSAYYDWGVYNAISNGGNQPDQWRILTKSEWDYIITGRANADQLYSIGTVNEVKGLILLPDAFVCPSTLTWTPKATDFTTNTYTVAEWQQLEHLGAVFVVWSNYSREKNNLYPKDLYSYIFWLSTRFKSGSESSYNALIGKNGNVESGWSNRLFGLPVRLVQDVPVAPSYSPKPVSVSDTKQVLFSRGNLQFNAVQGTHMRADGTMQQGTWRFAEYQYDVIGTDNQNISDTYDGYIDLFGWGTSGYDNTANDPLAVNYQPWAFSQIRTETNTTNIWGYGPSSDQTDADLVGTSAYYDWGVYNAISNGGNQPDQWRILTKSEWDYIITGRANADQLYSIGTVNEVKGLILLPDAFEFPSTLTWTPKATDYTTNTYTAAEWQQLEQLGVVFMSVSAPRSGKIIITGNARLTWLSTHSTGQRSYMVYLSSSGSINTTANDRCGGFPVRLVQEYDPTVITGEQAATLSEQLPIRKEIRNGQVFIIRGDQVFTVMGMQVK